jgi:hypothetical protein
MAWKDEFPHMADDMPADIPPEWQDVSWHNDTNPSFRVMSGGEGDSNFTECRLWVAESDSDLREFPNAPRFCIVYYNEDDSQGEVAFETEWWQSARDYVETRRKLGAAYAAAVGYNPFLDDPAARPEDVARALAEILAN